MRTGRHIFPPLAAIARRGGLALVAILGSNGLAEGAPSAPAVHPQASRAPDLSVQPPAGAQGGGADPSSRNVVARARMLECGHQWNNMKRAGTASGTWKDFSRGCLAQR